MAGLGTLAACLGAVVLSMGAATPAWFAAGGCLLLYAVVKGLVLARSLGFTRNLRLHAVAHAGFLVLSVGAMARANADADEPARLSVRAISLFPDTHFIGTGLSLPSTSGAALLAMRRRS